MVIEQMLLHHRLLQRQHADVSTVVLTLETRIDTVVQNLNRTRHLLGKERGSNALPFLDSVLVGIGRTR